MRSSDVRRAQQIHAADENTKTTSDSPWSTGFSDSRTLRGAAHRVARVQDNRPDYLRGSQKSPAAAGRRQQAARSVVQDAAAAR